VLIIAIVSLALLLGLCYAFIHRQFLPLRKLAVSAQRIADGYYDERIPAVRRRDEIGRLENHFIEMQQSLSTRMGEMQRLTDTLNQRGRVLQTAYEQAQVGESMKTNFLYNMSDQMMSPIDGIRKSVNTLCDRYSGLTEEDVNRLVEDIRLRGERVTELLNQLIKDSEKYE
jgi:methyl-accepting chemotaxis protein/sigma-B regulation protein RsbU (phosphoserine phosphatase)